MSPFNFHFLFHLISHYGSMQLAEVSRIGFQSVVSFCAVSVLFLFLFLLIGAFLCFGQDSRKVSSFSPIDRAKVTRHAQSTLKLRPGQIFI